jgi:hypothetical protein
MLIRTYSLEWCLYSRFTGQPLVGLGFNIAALLIELVDDSFYLTFIQDVTIHRSGNRAELFGIYHH